MYTTTTPPSCYSAQVRAQMATNHVLSRPRIMRSVDLRSSVVTALSLTGMYRRGLQGWSLALSMIQRRDSHGVVGRRGAAAASSERKIHRWRAASGVLTQLTPPPATCVSTRPVARFVSFHTRARSSSSLHGRASSRATDSSRLMAARYGHSGARVRRLTRCHELRSTGMGVGLCHVVRSRGRKHFAWQSVHWNCHVLRSSGGMRRDGAGSSVGALCA